MSKHWLVLTVTLILLLMITPLLAACDDDDETTSMTTTQATTTTETPKATTTEATTTPQTTTTTAPAGSLTIESSIGEILDDMGGEALLRKCLGDEIVDNPQMSMAFAMNLPTIAPMSGGVITDEMLACVNEGLGGAPMETAQPTTAQPTKTTRPTKTISGCTKEETFKFGATGQVFGQAAEARDPSQEIAMDEINEMGGIKIGDTCVKFKYTFVDNMGTAAGAAKAYQTLLYDFKAEAIYDTGGGTVNPAVGRPYTDQEKVFHFGNVPVLLGWVGEEYPYVFHLSENFLPQALYLLDWISKNRPDIKTVHGVREIQASWEDQTEVIEKAALPEYGIEYTGTEWAKWGTADFYPVLAAALEGEDPDAILCDFLSFYLMAKQARELGFKGTFLVVGAIPDYVFQTAPELIEGTVSLTPSLESPLVPQYYKDYRESYHERLHTYPFSIITFPQYLVPYYIAAAIEAAGSTDSDKLREVMETQTLTVEFPSGETLDVKMGGAEIYGVNHVWNPPEYLSVVQDGKPELMEVITSEMTDQYMDTYMKYR